MSTSTPASPDPGFDRWQLPAHVAQAVWRGTEVGAAPGRTLPTGFAQLDAALPGGGWPTQGLSEVLLAQSALCEWRLLAPALPGFVAGRNSRVYLVAPPKPPMAMGLAQLGLAPEQLVWIDVQALHCDAPVFVFRPEAALRDASPAPLRVSVALGKSWGIDLRIRKRRGASADEVLHLRALPANLDCVIPPRLHELQPIEVQREEVLPALGQPLAAARFQRSAH